MEDDMTYQKHELLGLRKTDGASPRDGRVKPVHRNIKEPLHHSGSIYESAPEHAGNIARNGAPKKLADVAVHSGQHSRSRDGQLLTGQAAAQHNAPDASSASPLDKEPPSKPAQTEAVKPSFGQRSRTQMQEVTPGAPGQAHAQAQANAGALHEARHGLGQKIIGSAVLSGSTKLPTENAEQ